jgi:hypothetical protein
MSTMGGRETGFAALLLQQAGGADGTHWSLQHRDPGRDRWLEVGRFRSKEVARTTLDALVAKGHGAKGDFRVRKVSITVHG